MLSLDYASKWKFISMNKKRIEILFTDAYANTNISLKAYEIIRGYIEINKISESVEIISLLKKYEKKLSILNGCKLVVVRLTYNCSEDENDLKDKIITFLEQCANAYQDEDFAFLFEIKLLIYKRTNQKDKIEQCLNWILKSEICNAEYYSEQITNDYFLILYLYKNLFSESETIHFMELFCEKYNNKPIWRWPLGCVYDWIQNIYCKSAVLFRHVLRTNLDNGNNYIKDLIEKEKWEELANDIGMIIEAQPIIFERVEDTLSELEKITEKTTETLTILCKGGITISISVPKLIIRNADCYNVESNKIVPFCDAIIEACGNNSNEKIKRLERKALCLKNKVLQQL